MTWNLTFIFLDNHNVVPPSADGAVHLPVQNNITVWHHRCF